MSEYFEKVAQFNREVIQYVQPERVTLLPQDVKELTLIQLREEIDEFEAATNVTEAVDGLLDLVYFAYGALFKMGVTTEQFNGCTEAIQKYNMRKVAGKKAERGYEGSAVDAIKPDASVPRPEVTMKVILGDTAE